VMQSYTFVLGNQ